MSVDETARHRLFNRAVEVLGAEEASILMAHLPPGGWPNLATKQDILELRQELRRDLLEFRETNNRDHSSLESRLKAFTFRAILTVNITMFVAFTAVVLAAVGLR